MAVFAFILGASLASFLEVVADRLPRGERPFGRSRCVSCKRTLEWFELVPIVSWFALKGRCRTCGARIPLRHLFGEALLGVAFVSAATVNIDVLDPRAGSFVLFRWLVLSALFVVFLADLRFSIIPDTASLGLGVFALMAVASAHVFTVPWDEVVPTMRSGVLGAAIGAMFLASFSLLSQGSWMGWGDVKLAFGLGMVFGFPAILFILLFAFIGGAIAGLALIALQRRRMRDAIPFGPFLVLGALPILFGFMPTLERLVGLSDFFSLW
jgi:prepilin signal peptidase PulO-like enzyme (type II secretory pathway)